MTSQSLRSFDFHRHAKSAAAECRQSLRRAIEDYRFAKRLEAQGLDAGAAVARACERIAFYRAEFRAWSAMARRNDAPNSWSRLGAWCDRNRVGELQFASWNEAADFLRRNKDGYWRSA